MAVKELFKKALTKMLNDNEFEKLAVYTETKTDVKAIRRYEEGLKANGADNIPIIPLIMNAPLDVLRYAFFYMLDLEHRDDK